jgi:hypothetical protein
MEIINYKEINKGCLQSKFDVLIAEWGLTIRECSLFKKDSRAWISLPSRQYEKDGAIKNYDLVSFDREARKRFDSACLAKISSGQVQRKEDKNVVNNVPF